jgi:hypothetical protein
MKTLTFRLALNAVLLAAEPVRLRIDFAKPDGTWAMPALALGQRGLQSDPIVEPAGCPMDRSGVSPP